MERLSRREFLRVSALATAATVAAACVTTTPTAAPVAQPAVAAQPTMAAQPAAPVQPPTGAPAAPVAAKFSEAPMLAEMVQQGKLPPVDDRVPANPFVIEGLDGIGNFGGTWRKSKKGMADGGTYRHMAYRGLIDINQDFEIIPYLAAAWEVSEDARIYTFHLRKGTKWSDGAPLTSEDFRFYYEDAILNRDLTSAHPEEMASVIGGERVPATIVVPDDLTVQYTFPEPKALFYYWANIMLNIPAIPKHFLMQFHKDYADKAALDKAVVDGKVDDWTQLFWNKEDPLKTPERPVHYPWVVQNVWSDEFVTAVRNPYYWEVDTAGNQLPYIDKVTYRDFADTQVTMMWAVNGELDCQCRHIGNFVNYTILKEGEKTGDYTVQLWKQSRVPLIFYNMTTKDARLQALFREKDFRIATSHALNRDEMRELLYDGFGVNKQYTPPDTSPLYYEKLAKAYLEYDPDKANALLDGLGISQRDAEGFRLWNDGSGQRVAFTALGQEPEVGEELLMVTDYLKDVGIQVNYRGVDRALAIEMTNANEVEMTLSVADCNLVPLADPQFYLKNAEPDSQAWCEAWTLWYLDPTNPNAEKPPEGHWIWTLWGIWEELQKTVGEDKQKELMWKIMDVWVDELPAPGLYGDLPMPIVVKNGFKGIKEGYDWDCCITIYEYIIDCSTWYWDDPAKHV